MNNEKSNSVILKAIENSKEILTDSDLRMIHKVKEYVMEGDYETAFRIIERYAENEYKSLANLNCLAGIIAFKIIENEEE